MSGETIVFNDKGLRQLLKAFKGQTIPHARVGVLGDKNGRENAGSNATVGAVHEFGSITHPRRSFLREPLKEQFSGFAESSGMFTKDTIKEVIQLGSLLPWIKKIGVIGEEVVLAAFETGGFGKWRPSLGKYKKNQQTLNETGQLMRSITSDVAE